MSHPPGRKRTRRLFREHAEQVDAKAHIARLDDAGVTGGGADPRLVIRRAAGRADDVHDARLRRKAGEFHRGGGRREIEDAFGLDEGFERLVGNGDPHRAGTGKLAGIAADKRRAGPLDRGMKAHAGGLVNDPDQCLAHTAGRADHNELHVRFVHRAIPLCYRICASATVSAPLPWRLWRRA